MLEDLKKERKDDNHLLPVDFPEDKKITSKVSSLKSAQKKGAKKGIL